MRRVTVRMVKSRWLTMVLVIVFVGLAASALFFAKKANDLKNSRLDAVQSAQVSRANELYAKIEKLIIVPKETETILGVHDSTTELGKNPFFKDAKDGDVYMIFPESGKAIIYRESENILVNVGSTFAAPDPDAASDDGDDVPGANSEPVD